MPSLPQEVARAAEARLRQYSHAMFREVFCTFDQGVLVLRGGVSSFCYTRLSQETVARVEGVVQVVNKIEVSR
jgi:osmotically-inducible protein OsmY